MIHTLPASTTLTPTQALASAASVELTDVLIIGYDTDGDLFVRSSRMDRKDALWMAEALKLWALGQEMPK